MTIAFSPVIAELFPAIMGLIAAAAGWGLAMYTKRVAQRDRDRS